MSRKVDTFRESLGTPVSISNFRVSIPGLDERTEVIVQATTFPCEKLRMIQMFYWGEQIYYPAVPDSNHRWKCSIPENSEGRTFKDIIKQKRLFYEDTTGLMLVPNSIGQDIDVALLNTDNSEIAKVTLKNSFILGPDDVTLSSSSPTQPLLWNVEFVYDFIKHHTS